IDSLHIVCAICSQSTGSEPAPAILPEHFAFPRRHVLHAGRVETGVCPDPRKMLTGGSAGSPIEVGAMDQLGKDMRFELRMIRKSPGFAAAAILTLALGIGGTTAIFSFVDAVLRKPLPFPGADQILNVWEKPRGGDRNGISTLNFLDWKNQNTVFESMAAVTGRSMTLSGGSEPVMLRGNIVSAPYFQVFGVRAALGRTFAPDEDQEGKNNVAIISNKTWRERFGADPNIIGRKLTLNAKPYTLIGVLPANSSYDRGRTEIWTPLVF